MRYELCFSTIRLHRELLTLFHVFSINLAFKHMAEGAGKIDGEARAGKLPIETVLDCLNQRVPRQEAVSAREPNCLTKEADINMQPINVPGDGNCGLHSLAVVIVATRKCIPKLIELVETLSSDNHDKQIFLNGLRRLQTPSDTIKLLNNRNFMSALQRKLRETGHNAIMDKNRHVKNHKHISELIPREDGKWASDEGLLIFGENILGLNITIEEIMNDQWFPTGTLIKPDAVSQLQGGHFTPFVPVVG